MLGVKKNLTPNESKGQIAISLEGSPNNVLLELNQVGGKEEKPYHQLVGEVEELRNDVKYLK